MKTTTQIFNTNSRWLRPAFAAGAWMGLTAIAAPSADVKPAIDPEANELLRRMSDFLTQAQFFSVSAEDWLDVQLGSGQQEQAGRIIDLQVRRPNRLHTEVRSTRKNRSINYDGKSITLLDRVQNFYGSIPAPGTLDAALDIACERFGITMPLEGRLE
jgi:hypothetical protein